MGVYEDQPLGKDSKETLLRDCRRVSKSYRRSKAEVTREWMGGV